MRFVFRVEIECDRTTGKFAPREELEAAFQEALEQADIGSVEGENGGQYDTSSWEVSTVDEKAEQRIAKQVAKLEKKTLVAKRDPAASV